jgi:release factor glutamine methyltransferase
VNAAELLARGAATIGDAALPADPTKEARFLLARLLGRTEAWLLAHPEAQVDDGPAAEFSEWVSRRAAGEPAHYLVGSCPFWGREMLVTPAVLIPRPETELIVEHALALPLPPRPRALDVGTGSGCLAVTLSLEIPGAVVTATDRSTAALAVARRNRERLGATVSLACGDLASHLRGEFDLVVANLPYIPDGEVASLPRDVREFEPREALAGGADGADLLRRLIADLPRLLSPAGVALLEVGPGQAALLSASVADAGLLEVARIRDAGGVDRVLVVRRASATATA